MNGDHKNDGNGTGYIGKTHRKEAASANERAGLVYDTAEAAIRAAGKALTGAKLAGEWSYLRCGTEVVRLARFNLSDESKEFRPVHPTKKGWKIGDPPGPLPLYRVDELPMDGPIYVCEGEKAADAAQSIRLPATTSAHGSSAASQSDWTPLAGRDVAILIDNDDAGRKYGRDVARLLVTLDPATRVKIVELPGLPIGGDIVEFIEAQQGRNTDAIRVEVEGLAQQAALIPAFDLIGGPVFTCLADVEAESIDWLWEGRIPLGKLTLLCGDPGLGKSFLTLDMAARVSTGTPWPDGSDCPIGSVIVISAEDGLADTVKPRLMRANADTTKITSLDCVKVADNKGALVVKGLRLEDIPNLEKALSHRPDCKLMVIDPVSAYMGDTDSHKNTDVRGLLAPLAKLAEQHHVAVLMISHLNKSAGGSAMYRATGSLAFVAASRAAFVAAKDKADPRRRLLLPIKNNLGNDQTGLAYSIIDGAVAWEPEPVHISADDALATEDDGEGRPGPKPQARNAATIWLRQRLNEGPCYVGDAKNPAEGTIRTDAADAGLSWGTIRRAAEELNVLHDKCQHTGKYQWRLPKLVAHDAPEQNNLRNLHNHVISAEKSDVLSAETAGCASSGNAGNQAESDGRER